MSKNRMNKIINRIEEAFSLDPGQIFEKRKVWHIARARMIAMYILKNEEIYPVAQILEAFDQPHGSVWHAVRRVDQMLETEPKTKKVINKLQEEISAI